MHLSFAPAQRSALTMSLASKVSIITGGPGVGKTTIVRALVDIFRARKLRTVLAAPTGRAAKRLEEATRSDGKTIHRLLKYNPSSNHFEHGPGNALEGDVFILDEVSMMDILLMNAFLRALPKSAVLVLVGDADQLPSVGPGNVLRDAIRSGVIPCRRLTAIFRQDASGLIVRNAHHVNNGERFEVGEAHPSTGGAVVVPSWLVPAKGDPTPIDYVMRETEGRWRIVDVLYDGTVSQVAVRRSEFVSIFRAKGLSGLIETIEKQAQALEKQ